MRKKRSPKTPKPGMYKDVPFEEYLAWDAVNNSSLGPLDKTPAHYRAAQENPMEATDAMRFGSLTHKGKLEPLVVLQNYVVMPEFEKEVKREDGTPYANPKATSAYKALVADFIAKNNGKEIVDQEWYDKVLGICESLRNHELASAWFCAAGPAELSIIWDDPITGLRCKGRLDKVDNRRRRITDLKTTANIGDFAWSFHRYRYDRQAAFYADGLEVLTGKRYEFCIVAVESSAPFCVRAAPVSERAMKAGAEAYSAALQTIKQCRESDEWPGYEDPEAWDAPEQVINDRQITVSGQLVTFQEVQTR